MKSKKVILLLIVFLFVLVGCEDKKESKISSDKFDFEFLKMENKSENIVYSPLSIKYALNMLNEGAKGETKTEIENVIKNLKLTKYENIEKKLSLANAVFVRDEYKEYIKDSYIQDLKQKYNAEFKYDSFANANNVNAFIEEKTFGIIKDMISDNLVQQQTTKMLLLNALAIDMEWENKFSASSTSGEDFTLASGEVIKATTMHKQRNKSSDVSFYKGDDIVSVSMNLKKYGNTQLEFMAIMPNNLNEYINNLDVKKIDDLKSKEVLASSTNAGINISIPKFEYEYDLDLSKDLKTLGIKKVFTKEADLTNMTNSPEGLNVSDALHKAKVEFSEDGIRAAAVTVIAVSENAMPQQGEEPKEIKIDKPFLFVIRDKSNGEVWFVGAVNQPNLWENDKAEYQR